MRTIFLTGPSPAIEFEAKEAPIGPDTPFHFTKGGFRTDCRHFAESPRSAPDPHNDNTGQCERVAEMSAVHRELLLPGILTGFSRCNFVCCDCR